MAAKNSRVTIVYRFSPPDKCVIADAASDLAYHLAQVGVEVHVVHTDGGYQGGGSVGKVIGTTHKIKSLYDGKQKLIRLLVSLIEGYLLIKKARQIHSDFTIVMTSPPLLNFWAARLFKRKKHPWILWSMDLFPEAFVAGQLTSPQNPVYRYLEKQTYSYPPSHLIALGTYQQAHLEEKFGQSLSTALLPCGVFLYGDQTQGETPLEQPAWRADEEKVYLGYCGNLGEAHSTDFVIWTIQHLDPSRQRLILVVYGAKAHVIKDYLKANPTKGVILLDHVPRPQLAFIDIHLASLEPEWVNVCVPSKLVSAVHNDSIFLFYGIQACDSWDYLKQAGWLIEKGTDGEAQVKRFLETIDHDLIDAKRRARTDLPDLLTANTQKAYKAIAQFVKPRTLVAQEP